LRARFDNAKGVLDSSGLTANPADLLPVLGSRSRISEMLSGKREPSKAQAKALAEFFGMPVDLFIM
jgi:HTH-type transcriptional regulator/antitoxin HigA